MIDINNEIRSLLFEHDYVTIPELGAFIAHYEQSIFSFENNTFSPPNRKISFNSILKQDDGLLITLLMKKQSISSTNAKEIISSYVKNIYTELENSNKYYIKNLGKLSLSTDNKVLFEPDLYNFHSESYGLDTIYNFNKSNYTSKVNVDEYMDVENSSIDTMEIKITNKKRSKNYLNTFLYLTPIVLLVAGLITVILINPIKNEAKANSSLNPFDYIEPVKNWFEKTEEESNKVIPESEIPDFEKTAYKSVENFILIGVFTDSEKAKKLYNMLVLNGLTPKIENIESKNNVMIPVKSIEEGELVSKKLKQLIGETGVLIQK